jgi:hypothetical protein
MAVGYNPRVVTDGLVLALDAANVKSYPGSGTTWTDLSGKGNNGTLSNGVQHTDGPFFGAGYVEFDGTGDNLSISSTSSLGGFSGDFTIEFWFKGDDQAGFAVFLESWVSFTSSTQKWAIQAEGGGTTNMIWVRDGDIKFTTSGIDAFDNAWHHHAVVRDGSTITYYIDGISRGSETHSAALTPGTDFIIGEFSSDDYEIEGYLSNVRIVEGTAIYTSNFTPPTKSLTAVPGTKLLTCQGNTITDASSIGHAITVNGDTKASEISSFDFDGSNDQILVDNSIRTTVGEFVATNSNPFSISVWFKPDTSKTNRNCIFSKANGFGNSGNIYLEYSGTDLTAVIRGLGNPDFYTSLSNNTWHEVTLCWDGTTFKSYVNGSFVSNLNQGTASSQNVQVKIGNSGGNNEPFAGQISNVKVYTKGLSAAEVLQNYNALKGRYGI